MLCNITANQNDFNTYTAMLQSCITSLFQHVKQKEKLNVNIKCDNLTFMKIIESSLTESLTSSALPDLMQMMNTHVQGNQETDVFMVLNVTCGSV